MSYYVQLKEVSIQRKKKNKTERKRKKRKKLEPRRNRRKKRKTIIKRCRLALGMTNTMRVNHVACGWPQAAAREVASCILPSSRT